MTGRQFDTPNTTRPACVEQMAQTAPACFSSRATWSQWLLEAWRMTLHDKAARNAMSRGVVPDYCQDCGSEFRSLMHLRNKCHPPHGGTPPPMVVWVVNGVESASATAAVEAIRKATDAAA